MSGWYAHIKEWMIDPQHLMAASCFKCTESDGQDAVSYFSAAAWNRNGDDWTALSEDDSWACVMKVADDGASFADYEVDGYDDDGNEIKEMCNEQQRMYKCVKAAFGLQEGDVSKRLPPLYIAGKKYTYCSWVMRDGGIRDCFFGQKDPKGGACLAVTDTGHIAFGIWDETAGQNPSDARKCVVDFVQWLQTAA